MIDIDFRYVMRTDPKLTAQMANPPMIKVLQWRKRIVMDPGNPIAGRLGAAKWTDWQDVRTEEE